MSEIQSAAQWLGKVLYDEAKYVNKVEDQVKELRDEIMWMQHFLRDVDESQINNIMARSWICQFRELSNEAEDTVQKFCIIMRAVNDRRMGGNYILNRIKKYSKLVWDLRLLHQIGSEAEILRRKITFMTSKFNTYDIKHTMGESSSTWLLTDRHWPTLEENIFGREKEMQNVVDELIGTKCKVVSICGAAGVGKTFLAQKIFDYQKIRKHFDAFAWAYVSSPCQSSAVLQHLLSSLTSKSKEQISQVTDDELKTELRKVLRKSKCFIVLDGVWGNEVWDSLKKSIPFASLDNGSKLLITNQLEEVATHVSEETYIYPLQSLDEMDSKQLLDEKVGHNLLDKFEQKDRERVNDIIDKILKFCNGLPLLISVLGGVLATKKTMKDWEDVDKYISSYLIEDWKRILELSYYDLPFQLKPTFLYLGYFPTNLEISAKKIIRLWEAEGLVSYSDDETSEVTLEDVAEHCLAELVERSLVQVGSRGLTGKVKTFLVHELVHEKLCIAKATQGTLLSIVKLVGDDQNLHSSLFNKYQHVGTSFDPYLDSQTIVESKIRRLAIYYTSDNSGKLPFRDLRYLRSLLVFNKRSSGVLMPLERFLKLAFNNWRLLKVLQIENFAAKHFPTEVGSLIYLRYLSLKGSCIFNLPSTIQKLRCLQTLDLRVLSWVHMRIPDVLWKLERLLHLYLPSNLFNLCHKTANLRLKGLKNLETLSNFSNKCRAEDVAELSNLRRFASCDTLSNDNSIKPLLSLNSKLMHLERVSLKLDGQQFHMLKENRELVAYRRLCKLWVKGKVEQSITVIEPCHPFVNLIRLSFHSTEFESDPMEVLEKLPLLKKLSLKYASYTGVAMKCSSGYFEKLKYLTLKGLESLQVWTVEKEAMRNLSHLKINGCQKLEMLPNGLEHVENLKDLAISFMPFSFFDRKSPKDLKEWSQYPKVKHVPCINVSYVLDLEYEVPIEMPGCQGSTSQVPEMQESVCCCRE